MLREWNDIPEFMRCDEVKEYYDILSKKKNSLILKRIFDVVVAALMLIILAIPMLIISVMIKLDSKGPVMYRQERVTAYGKKFKIKKNNDYAMWLKVIKKADCYLLDECLARYRRGRKGSVSTHGYGTMIRWHYILWHEAMGMNAVTSLFWTGMNLVCGV